MEENGVNFSGRTENSAFARAMHYAKAKGVFKNQKELAKAAGVTETTISRIKCGGVREALIDTLMKINAACGNIFNIEFLQGNEDAPMLAADVNELVSVPVQQQMANYAKASGRPQQNQPADAALLKSKEETLVALRKNIETQELVIQQQRQLIVRQQEQIDALTTELRHTKEQLIASLSTERHYGHGVSEPGQHVQFATDDIAGSTADR